MRKSTITKVLLCRKLYQLSLEHLNSDNEISLSVGVILLQDSVENFLLAIAEHLNAEIRNSTNFDNYFDKINNKLENIELPFRFRLNSLNKLRVNAKHYGLSPAKSETNGLAETVKEFFKEVSLQVLNKEFVSISLVDLLKEGEAKGFLVEAEKNFIDKNYIEVLVNCRKAIYVEIETNYDISPYIDEGERGGIGIMLMGYKAPYYAQNKDYIEKYVKEPTDYIVYDYDQLDLDLLRSGMNRTDYWNVCRLTPALYRKDTKSNWIIKEEFQKLEEEGIKDRAEYVLDSTINLILAKHIDLTKFKTPDYRNYSVKLKNEMAPIYEKADKNSKIVGAVPAGTKKIYVDSKTPALAGDDIFWSARNTENGSYLYGFINNSDVE